MTTITELVQQIYEANECCNCPDVADVAGELEKALPKWTQITDDPATWPPQNVSVMTISKCYDGNWYEQDVKTLLPGHPVYNDDTPVHLRCFGNWWRPLCDLDYPPGEQP